jgi:hypothetical protein
MNGRGIEGKLDGSPLSDALYRDGQEIGDDGEPKGYISRYDESFEQFALGMSVNDLSCLRLSQLITDPPINKWGPHNFVFPLDSQFSFSNYIKVIYTDYDYHSFSTANGSRDQLYLLNGNYPRSEFVMPEPDNVGKVTIHYLSRTN